MKNTSSVCAQDPGVLGVWPISTPALSSHLISVSQTQPSRNAAPAATHLHDRRCYELESPERICSAVDRSNACVRTCMVTAVNASHFVPSPSWRLALPCFGGVVGKGCDAMSFWPQRRITAPGEGCSLPMHPVVVSFVVFASFAAQVYPMVLFQASFLYK